MHCPKIIKGQKKHRLVVFATLVWDFRDQLWRRVPCSLTTSLLRTLVTGSKNISWKLQKVISPLHEYSTPCNLYHVICRFTEEHFLKKQQNTLLIDLICCETFWWLGERACEFTTVSTEVKSERRQHCQSWQRKTNMISEFCLLQTFPSTNNRLPSDLI